MDLDEREERRPRGRCRAPKACSADLPPQRKGAAVEFSMGASHYVVDVTGMYQKNLVSGNRRTVRRTGGTWFFDASSSASSRAGGPRADPSAGARWTRYESGLQRLLEEAYREHGAPGEAAGEEGAPEASAEGSARGLGPAELLARASSAREGSLAAEELRAGVEAALAPGVDLGTRLRILEVLTLRHGARCTEDDVRRATLSVGSLAVLQIVLRSSPEDLQLAGMDIFERRFDPRFARLKINDDGLKRCLKALLARGARLGQPSCVPASKLLRKIDADAFPEWVRRCLRSPKDPELELPEPLQARVEAFL